LAVLGCFSVQPSTTNSKMRVDDEKNLIIMYYTYKSKFMDIKISFESYKCFLGLCGLWWKPLKAVQLKEFKYQNQKLA
jgi:hypothetical protein